MKKCVYDLLNIINYEPFDILLNLTYEKLPQQILDRKEQ
jgi:hypothetical protein